MVLDLIQALQIEPAARILPSRIAERTLSGDLAIIYGRVDSNQLDIASAIPLVEQIVGNGHDAPTWNDADVWCTVFELVARSNPITLPNKNDNEAYIDSLYSTPPTVYDIDRWHRHIGLRRFGEGTSSCCESAIPERHNVEILPGYRVDAMLGR